MKKKMWYSVLWNSKDENMKRKVISLLTTEYGEQDITTAKYYDWQYIFNPFGEAIIKLAMTSQGEVVGQYVVIPINLNIDKKNYKGGLSVLTLTNKNYRGQKIFTILANEVYEECRKRGLNFVLGFPNQNSYYVFIKKLGFVDIGELELLIKPIRFSKIIKKWFPGIFGKILSSFGKALDYLAKPNLKTNSNIVELSVFDEKFDEFNKTIEGHYRFYQPRTAKFLNWRYIQNPREYINFAWYENTKLRGFLVLRIAEVSGLKCGMIVDFLVDKEKGNDSVGKELIKKSIQRSWNLDACLVGFLTNWNTSEKKMIEKCGFYKCPKFLKPQPFPVIFKNIATEKSETFSSLENWMLTMGDYDAV